MEKIDLEFDDFINYCDYRIYNLLFCEICCVRLKNMEKRHKQQSSIKIRQKMKLMNK